MVIGYRGSNTSVRIPQTITYDSINYKVTSIGDSAFSGCTSLTSVTIGNSITSIGDSAFEGCNALMGVTIFDSVISMGYNAFSDCLSLTIYCEAESMPSGWDSSWNPDNRSVVWGCILVAQNGDAFVDKNGIRYTVTGNNKASVRGYIGNNTSVNIPKTIIYNSISYEVTSIDRQAFYRHTSLTSVIIPNSVTSIGGIAFSNCTNLTSIVIPNSVTIIGDSAFYRCTSLTSIEIPNSVTSIGDSVFNYCTSLESITVDENNTAYKSIGGNLYTKDGKTLIQYALGKKDTSFVIPDGVTSIGNYAFYYCDSITSVTIPNSVTSIGAYAFAGCTSLTIYCEAEAKPTGWNSSWKNSSCPVVWGYKENA